jgi:PAS domain S-box-containing protein
MPPRPPASAPAATGAATAGLAGEPILFEAVFDAAAVGMVLVRGDGTIARVNPAAEELLGAPAGQLDGCRLSDLVHPDDRDELAVDIAIVLAARSGRAGGEQRWVRPDGSVIRVRSDIGVAAHDPEPLLVASLQDVTARRRTLDALTLSEMRYRALVDNLTDTVIAIFDGDLRLTIVEGARSRGEIVPSRLEGRVLADALGDRFADVEAHFHAALLGEHRSFDFGDPSGVTWWVKVVPLRDDAGRVLGGIAVWRDVTERKRAELELAARARELERSNAELEQFAYIASHDLSEPLRMVTSYLQLLDRRYHDQLDDDAREFIRFAVDGAARMRALIDDLLAYSRVGRHDPPREEVDLQELVAKVVTMLTAGREDGGRVELGTLPVVDGEAQMLGQLFQNLIGNALKFRHPERPALVRVSAEPTAGGRWRLAVADNGIGIDPAHAERVFGVFQRLHSRDEYAGTGVGLAIARKVVERHGGSIWLEPEPGGGSRFVFELLGAS